MQVIGRSARMARHHKRHEAAEINLTSMIDFLMILVFFLLVHGGFVRLAILELNLPTSQLDTDGRAAAVPARGHGAQERHRGRRSTQGLLNKFEKDGDKYPYDKLSSYLARRQAAVPGEDRRDAAARAGHPVRRARGGHGPRARLTERPSDDDRPARARGAVSRDLDRRRAGAATRTPTMRFMGRAARMARHHKRHKGERGHQPRVDDGHVHGARVLPARVLDRAGRGAAELEGRAAARVDRRGASRASRRRDHHRA